MWSKQRPQFAHSAQIHRRQNYSYMPMKSGLSFAYVLSFVCICINCITGIVFKCCYILGLVLRAVIRATQYCLTVPPYCVISLVITHCYCLYCGQIYKGKGKGIMEFHLTATECHLPYGITQCYLSPEHTPP